MYQQPSATYRSADSLRRLSTNNPFRQNFAAPRHSNASNGLIRSPNAAFDDWVEKNKKFIDESSDDEDINENIVNFYGLSSSQSPVKEPEFARPEFPTRPARTGSDSTVSYAPRLERYVLTRHAYFLPGSAAPPRLTSNCVFSMIDKIIEIDVGMRFARVWVALVTGVIHPCAHSTLPLYFIFSVPRPRLKWRRTSWLQRWLVTRTHADGA